MVEKNKRAHKKRGGGNVILLKKYLMQRECRGRVILLYAMGLSGLAASVLGQLEGFCRAEGIRLSVCTEGGWEAGKERGNGILVLTGEYPHPAPPGCQADRKIILADGEDAHLEQLAAALEILQGEKATILFSAPEGETGKMYDLLEDYEAYALPLSPEQAREVLTQ